MKSKTIFDAVNELHGEVLDSNVMHIVIERSTGHIILCGRPDLDVLNSPTWKHLCSIGEFNALVDAMSTNFGECSSINVSDYKIVTKTPLKPVEPVIDWKDAPDGMSKFGRVGNNGGEVFYNSEGYFYKESGKYFPFDKENECTFDFDKVSLVATRPTQSNTYTQEMADNGVFPSVGMECLINFPDIDDVWYEYTIDFMGNYTFIASCEDVSERFGYVDDVHFKPIKPLTPPLPLIDGKAYQFECNGHKNVNGIYNDDGYFIDHNANAYIDCTNIQPLTLKEK